jgi:hypothetical protein
MARIVALVLFAVPVTFLAALQADDPVKGDDPKEALQSLQELIGGWKGSGTSERDKSSIWPEKAGWSWRFKDKDVWMSLDVEKSKVFKSAEMRFLSDKGKFQFTTIDPNGKKIVYLGEMKKGKLTLEGQNPETKDIEQIKMETAAGGIRLVMTFATKPADRTLFSKTMQISYTKEGEALAGATAKKGPECVVTGGLGTMAVSFMGQTYYVCCSGCRDAFNENPAKILKEYAARKKAEKGK